MSWPLIGVKGVNALLVIESKLQSEGASDEKS